MIAFDELMFYFPDSIRRALLMLPPDKRRELTEIRLRAERPLSVTAMGGRFFLSADGRFVDMPDKALMVRASDMEYSFNAVCEYSVYSCQREISEGFITVKGGNRVGLCGTAVFENGGIKNIRNISSMNFRIAHEVIGCADGIYRSFLSSGRKSILIAGAPASGKTTVLRDLCRLAGESCAVALVDERSEIAAVYRGVAGNNVGPCTDILDGFTKRDGIQMALRTLSPDIIVCDEIAPSDVAAISEAANSGVSLIASAHAESLETLLAKHKLRRLFKEGVFDYAVYLGSGDKLGRVVAEMSLDKKC